MAKYFFGLVAHSSPKEFPAAFDQLRRRYPAEIAKLCVIHIAENGLDEIGEKVVGWLRIGELYLRPLLDPNLIRIDAARKALQALRASDDLFSFKFSKVLTPEDENFDPALLPRALELLVGLDNHEIFLPRLQVLTKYPNAHVRSKAVKALCQIRPSKSLVERQLQVIDSRVRANALEAIWHVKTDEAKGIFLSALTDCNHRVVLNALVGLYFLNEESALDNMLAFASSESVEFRRAATWALEFIADPSTRTALLTLASDSLPGIRATAQKALAKLASEPSEPQGMSGESVELQREAGPDRTVLPDAPFDRTPVIQAPEFLTPSFTLLYESSKKE